MSADLPDISIIPPQIIAARLDARRLAHRLAMISVRSYYLRHREQFLAKYHSFSQITLKYLFFLSFPTLDVLLSDSFRLMYLWSVFEIGFRDIFPNTYHPTIVSILKEYLFDSSDIIATLAASYLSALLSFSPHTLTPEVKTEFIELYAQQEPTEQQEEDNASTKQVLSRNVKLLLLPVLYSPTTSSILQNVLVLNPGYNPSISLHCLLVMLSVCFSTLYTRNYSLFSLSLKGFPLTASYTTKTYFILF